jgi:hypothetical protein
MPNLKPLSLRLSGIKFFVPSSFHSPTEHPANRLGGFHLWIPNPSDEESAAMASFHDNCNKRIVLETILKHVADFAEVHPGPARTPLDMVSLCNKMEEPKKFDESRPIDTPSLI